MAWYVETSAFLPLAIADERTPPMRAWAEAEEWSGGALWSSDLLRTEAVRAARAVSPEALRATRDRLDRIGLIAITTDTFRLAAQLDPAVARSIDALHLAAALGMGDDLDGVVTYDGQLADGARTLGLAVLSP